MAVFISYATERRDEANRLAKLLAAEGIATFVDHDSISLGEAWQRTIAEAVGKSDALVVLVCRASDTSHWVSTEVNRAIEKNIPIFPVQLEEVGPDGLRFSLGPKQWCQWDGHDTDSLSRLVADLRRAKSQGPNVRRSAHRTAPGGTEVAVAPAGNAQAKPTATGVAKIHAADTLKRSLYAPVPAAVPEKANAPVPAAVPEPKDQTDEQLIRTVSKLRNKYDRQLKEKGTNDPSVLRARETYVAAWADVMRRTLGSLPAVPNTVQLTRPRRILLGQITRQAKYERFGIRFNPPRPGTRRDRRLEGLDDQTGAYIAGKMSDFLDPEDRRKLIVALGSGQTAPIEAIVRLLPEADLARVRDC